MEKAYGLEIPESLEEACSLRRTALLVYDMPVGILRQLRDGVVITAKVVEVLQAAHGAGLRVFFMRHMSLPTELAGEARRLKKPPNTTLANNPFRAWPDDRLD